MEDRQVIRNTLILMLFPFLASCSQAESLTNKAYANKTIFFAEFAGKFLPFFPVEPISSTVGLDTYVAAEYDADGRLIVMTKYNYGKIYFVQRISYDGKDMAEITVENSEGKITRRKTNKKP